MECNDYVFASLHRFSDHCLHGVSLWQVAIFQYQNFPTRQSFLPISCSAIDVSASVFGLRASPIFHWDGRVSDPDPAGFLLCGKIGSCGITQSHSSSDNFLFLAFFSR